MGTPWGSICDILLHPAAKNSVRKIGVEWERFAIWPDGTPFVFEQFTGEKTQELSSRTAFQKLSKRKEWLLVGNEQGEPSALVAPEGSISLEPGNQWEFTTDPLENINDIATSLDLLTGAITQLEGFSNLRWYDYGVNPFLGVEKIPLIPSKRYQIMTQYLGMRGKLGLHMMRRTTSVQVNIDFQSEGEAIEMLKLAALLTPLSYALFAHSPDQTEEGETLLSYRQHIWQNTDPARTGIWKEIFDPKFTLLDYAKKLWQMPLMYLPDAEENFIASNGKSLAQLYSPKRFFEPSFQQYIESSIGQVFTEARLKPGYLEVRALDGLPPQYRNTAIAFWVGVMSDVDMRREILRALSHATHAEVMDSLQQSIRVGLEARFGNQKLLHVGKNVAFIANEVLKRRGLGEERHLWPIFEILEECRNPAQRLLGDAAGVPEIPRQPKSGHLRPVPLKS